MLAVVRRIAAAVQVPVSADMEAGYGDSPEQVAETAHGVLEAGAVVALTAAGVSPGPALAFALVYHSVHLVPGTLLGVLALAVPWE